MKTNVTSLSRWIIPSLTIAILSVIAYQAMAINYTTEPVLEAKPLKVELSMKEWVFTKLEQSLSFEEALNGMYIIQCESKWDADDYNVNKNSIDLGLWQINSVHEDISNADKLNYKKATEWTIKKRLNDGNWSAWVCTNKLGI